MPLSRSFLTWASRDSSPVWLVIDAICEIGNSSLVRDVAVHTCIVQRRLQRMMHVKSNSCRQLDHPCNLVWNGNSSSYLAEEVIGWYSFMTLWTYTDTVASASSAFGRLYSLQCCIVGMVRVYLIQMFMIASGICPCANVSLMASGNSKVNKAFQVALWIKSRQPNRTPSSSHRVKCRCDYHLHTHLLIILEQLP